MKFNQLPYLLAGLQGIYYAFTGLWSLISIETFQKVTGPKTDLWLVKTVGVLVLVSGAVLFLASLRKKITWEIFILAMGQALGLAIIDFVYSWQGRISLIYMADAFVEMCLVLFWIVLALFQGLDEKLEEREGDIDREREGERKMKKLIY